ncbi:MAG: hypothetical protein ABL901_02825 [Hyphomicrobiaceae bacterium]|nr:hypothetical protein [Hyphomicrobiaceae bacterium]
MTYFNGGTGGYYWLGNYVPLEKTTKIYCDGCAEAAIPLPPIAKVGLSPGSRHWGTGFKWAPRYGAKCSKCGKEC